MKFKAFIFDMDGTLLNTLADIVDVTNRSLASVGYPPRTTEEILGYIGNGNYRLLQQAVPDGAPKSIVDHAFESWKMLYGSYGNRHTRPFAGMVETLTQMKEKGVALAVLSNKYDAGVQMLVKDHFSGLFDVAHGERPGIPRKPDPAGLLAIIDELGCEKSAVAYVGDADPDIETASRGGVYFIGVDWGFGGESFRADPRIDTRVAEPEQLLSFC
ncbi:MAG: HAD family hydrolase [Eggerthellaceae bacterium]|jgi:phosphoglycolate phosphatase